MRRMSAQRIAFVVPAYNEHEVIGDVVEGALTVADVVAVVDDGSTDGTADRAKAAGAVVLRHEINLGQGAAIQTGIECACREEAFHQQFERLRVHIVDVRFDHHAVERRFAGIVDHFCGYGADPQSNRVRPGKRLLTEPIGHRFNRHCWSAWSSIGKEDGGSGWGQEFTGGGHGNRTFSRENRT